MKFFWQNSNFPVFFFYSHWDTHFSDWNWMRCYLNRFYLFSFISGKFTKLFFHGITVVFHLLYNSRLLTPDSRSLLYLYQRKPVNIIKVWINTEAQPTAVSQIINILQLFSQPPNTFLIIVLKCIIIILPWVQLNWMENNENIILSSHSPFSLAFFSKASPSPFSQTHPMPNHQLSVFIRICLMIKGVNNFLCLIWIADNSKINNQKFIRVLWGDI